MYEKGLGVRADDVTALHYYEQACERESGAGCSVAASFYENGRGTETDIEKAEEYYRKSCSFEDKIFVALISNSLPLSL